MTLENLLRIGKLKAHAADRIEIDRLLSAADRALNDAMVPDLSSDGRLDLAYRAIMQVALAAMLANGYRPATSEPGYHHRDRNPRVDRWTSEGPRLTEGSDDVVKRGDGFQGRDVSNDGI